MCINVVINVSETDTIVLRRDTGMWEFMMLFCVYDVRMANLMPK